MDIVTKKCIRNIHGEVAVSPHRIEIAAENLRLTVDAFMKQEVIELGNGHYVSYIIIKETDNGY